MGWGQGLTEGQQPQNISATAKPETGPGPRGQCSFRDSRQRKEHPPPTAKEGANNPWTTGYFPRPGPGKSPAKLPPRCGDSMTQAAPTPVLLELQVPLHVRPHLPPPAAPGTDTPARAARPLGVGRGTCSQTTNSEGSSCSRQHAREPCHQGGE